MNEDITFCEKFKGGWCPKYQANIPRLLCFAKCDVTKNYPSLIKQGISFAKAITKQIRAGRPERSPELIEKLKTICESCFYYNKDGHPKFQDKGPQCRECGCGLVLKQAWSTSHCRKGHWDEVLKDVGK